MHEMRNPARDGLSAGGERIRTFGSAMCSHRRQRDLGATPPDPVVKDALSVIGHSVTGRVGRSGDPTLYIGMGVILGPGRDVDMIV
jgi:hypothetical protein